MQLFICEKPSQAKDYAKALGIKGGSKNGYIQGDGIQITWCVGHLLQPLDPNDYGEEYKKWNLKSLPILPRENWDWKPNPKTKSQLKVVRDLLKGAKEVVIASDADREGELIVVAMLEKYKYTGKRSRVWTAALDKASLTKAIKNKKDAKETFTEFLAASTRQKADWIHGMNLTRGMSVINQGRVEGVLSIGRVQTAVLNFIVMRDLEIENFKAKDFYDMTATFTLPEGSYLKADWAMPKSFLDEVEEKCIDKSKIEAIVEKIRGKDGKINKSEKTRKKESAPLLFSLSELQTECNSKFGYGAADVLAIAQSLYETHKATTYPRTDCQYINNEQFADVAQVMASMKKSDPNTKEIVDFIDGADTSKKTKVWNDKKVAESSHHAIIPTLSPFNIAALNDREMKVYDLIRRRYIAQFYPEAESDATKIEIVCEGETFKASGSMPVLSGWKDIIGKKSESKELPVVNEGDVVTNTKPKIESKKTKPPSRYNEGSLIKEMKNAAKFVEDKNAKSILKGTEGIGTEATRANIIEVLFKRDYIKNDKKNVISTDKGRGLIQYAPEKAKSIEMTAYWESQLEQISKGKLDPQEFLSAQEEALEEMLNEIKSGKCTFEKAVGAKYTCPNCESGLRKIKSKKTGKPFWVCMAGDSCKTIFADSRGKPYIPKKVEQGDVEHTCEVCKKGKLVRKISQKKVHYWQCPEQECKQFYSDDNMTPKLYVKEVIDQGDKEHTCFECNKGKLERKKGQYGFYWKCLEAKCGKNFKENSENMEPIKPKPKPTSDYQCPNCKLGKLVKRTGKKGDFWGCNNFPKCKTIVSDKDGKPEGI